MKRRLDDLDRAKGLAIFLVVVGHIVARTPPTGNDWYVVLKDAIYLFHMPFFMFISGVAMGLSFHLPRSAREYIEVLRRRFIRLFPAYALFGLLILAGKLLTQGFLEVDNAPRDFLGGLVDILVRPASSSASSLWYIYVLFSYYLLMPILLLLTRNRVWPLIVAAGVVHFIHVTDIFLVDTILEYFVYVCLGIYVARNYARYAAAIDQHRLLFLSCFGLSLVVAVLLPLVSNDVVSLVSSAAIPKLVVGCLSIPALHALVRSRLLATSTVLLTLGVYTFPIYLMNTIAIGLAKESS